MSAKKIVIYCVNLRRHIEVDGGASLYEIAGRIKEELGFEPIAARVNNKSEYLGYAVYSPKQIEFVGIDSALGRRV